MVEAFGHERLNQSLAIDEAQAWIGHDLRTPLASVRALIDALVDGMVEDSATQNRYLRTAQRDIHALSLLIDNLYLTKEAP